MCDGVRTRILKVKAHSEVTGNEEADVAAKAAAGADETHDFVMPAHKPFGGQWQPALLVACVGLQSGFSKNKLAAQTLLFEQGGMNQ